MYKKLIPILIVLLVVAVLGALAFFLYPKLVPQKNLTSTTEPIRIGLSMDATSELRWQNDRDRLIANAEKAGASLVVSVAEGSDEKQISQIKNFITQKVDVIIIIPHNASALADVIKEAHDAGIKVIAYDRLILNSDIDLYISFDSTKVGELSAQYVMAAVPGSITKPHVAYVGGADTDFNATLVRNGAMSVLTPLIKEGKIEMVYDESTPDWRPDLAYKKIKALLASGVKIDAVVAANDGTAGGVIQALTEAGLAGKVPVSGQDAELPALQRIVAGTQTVSSYKSLKELAVVTIDSAIALAKNENVKTTSTTNNKLKDVPSYLINPIAVTKDNIRETVVADGFQKAEEIFGKALPH